MFLNQVPEFTGSLSGFPYSPELEAKYAFKTRFDEVVNMSVRAGNVLYVPRETCPTGLIDRRKHFPPVAINCKPLIPRNEEQAPLIAKSIALLKSGQNHIFEAPTGWGKTVAGSHVAVAMGQPTLFVVNKEDLIAAWRDTLINVLGIPPHLIGIVRQDRCEWEGKMFVIGMVHSLIIPDRYPEAMYRYFGLMVLDEAHLMAADSFQRICWKVPALHRLSFSATTTRPDGKFKIIEAHMGPVMVKGTLVPMKPKVFIRKTGWSIPTRKKWVEDHYEHIKIPHGPGRMMLVNKAMAESNQRNALIVEFVMSAYQNGRVTLLMGDTIEHLKIMFHLLASAGIPGAEMGYYCGTMTAAQVLHAKVSRVVLATYKKCDTGTNVPHWDSLGMLNPRSNVQQAIGRVMRFLDGKRQPAILELVDNDKILVTFHLSRMKTYNAVNADFVDIG